MWRKINNYSSFRGGTRHTPSAKARYSTHVCRTSANPYPRTISQTHRGSRTFYLKEEYKLKGIHLNGRNPNLPEGYKGHVSCSCHSLDEVKERKSSCDYVFLSPVFNSISKLNYNSAYTAEELRTAAKAGIIDKKS